MKKVEENETMVVHTFKIPIKSLKEDFGSVHNAIESLEALGCFRLKCKFEDITNKAALPCTCGEMPVYNTAIESIGCRNCDKYANGFFDNMETQIKKWNEAIAEEKNSFIEGECEDVTNKGALPELEDK